MKSSALGLVPLEGGEPVLLRDEVDGGAPLTLRPRGDADALRHLGGCTVDVSGPQLGRRLWVTEWSVVTAFDGSEPYVGVVRDYRGELALVERRSGGVFLLEAETAAPLADHREQLVMVMGFAVGPQLLQVMGYRVLEAEE